MEKYIIAERKKTRKLSVVLKCAYWILPAANVYINTEKSPIFLLKRFFAIKKMKGIVRMLINADIVLEVSKILALGKK